MPVTISIILTGSQLDAGSLTQTEMNEKAPEEYFLSYIYFSCQHQAKQNAAATCRAYLKPG